jgi:lipopolysaccharide export system protein LptC
MRAAPLPMQHGDRRASAAGPRARAAADLAAARRKWLVGTAKRLLPLVALALLTLVAMWPELTGDKDHTRLSFRRGDPMPQSGQMQEATYHGVDARDRPYTVTARTAQQVSPERVDLVEPKGDLELESGNWLLVEARRGVYLQHMGDLDLSGDTLTTNSAAVDIKAGAASGAELTHAEGPFGVLDAQGFALVDKGAVIQFSGPGHLVMNAAQGHATPAARQTTDSPPPSALSLIGDSGARGRAP